MGDGWADVLAAVGGAAGGANSQMRFDETNQRQRDLQELRSMLSLVAEEGRNNRATAGNETRTSIADANRSAATDKADADRKQRADAVVANTDLGYSKMASQEGLGYTRDSTTRRGQDQQLDEFWNGTNPVAWDRNAVTADNNRRTTATSRANALTAASTSTANAATAADTAGKNRRARNVVDVLRMRQKDSGSLLGGGDDATDWANEFDSLYNDPDRTAAEALQGGGAGAGAPGVVPVAPRQAPAAASPAPAVASPAAAPVKLPPGLVLGARVTLRDGSKVIVTKVNPDGTFEHKPAQ